MSDHNNTIGVGSRFIAPDSDVTFTVMGPDPKVKGNWLLRQNVVTSYIRRRGHVHRKINEKQSLVSKSEEEINEMKAAKIANQIVSNMTTMGMHRSQQHNKRRTATNNNKLQMIRDAAHRFALRIAKVTAVTA